MRSSSTSLRFTRFNNFYKTNNTVKSQNTKMAIDEAEGNQINSRLAPANMMATMSDGYGFGTSIGRTFVNNELGTSTGNMNLDNSMGEKTALIIIDIQNDFCEGSDPPGSLAVPGS